MYRVRKAWDLPVAVDFLCYTPEEFTDLAHRTTIVSVALTEGTEIAAAWDPGKPLPRRGSRASERGSEALRLRGDRVEQGHDIRHAEVGRIVTDLAAEAAGSHGQRFAGSCMKEGRPPSGVVLTKGIEG